MNTMVLQPRVDRGKGRAIVLAVLVHLAFFVLIVFGVRWTSKPVAPSTAELVDPSPKVSAPPKAEAPPPPPAPPVEEKPPQPVEKTPPVEEKPAPPPPKVDIAAEKAKEEKRKREEEKKKLDEAKKQEEVKRQREMDEAIKRAQADAKRKAQEEAKRKTEIDDITKEREAARAAEAAAQKSAGDRMVSDAINRIRVKIQNATQVPDNVSGKPSVDVRVTLLPTGEVLSATISRGSGNAAYDEAVLRGIQRAQPLPLPPNPEVFPQFRDLKLVISHER